MIINDLYNNKKPSLSEGMKAQDLAMYCEKLVAEKGWDAAYKHARFMAAGATDPAWGSVLKYLDAMKDGINEAHDAAAKEIHGNLFHDSIPPGAEKHHVSAVLKAHGLKDTDAKDVINRVRKMGYTGPRLGKQETDEGRMVKGPGGVPLDRQGRPVVAKAKAPAPLKMRKWIVVHDGSHGEGGKDIIEAPNAETAWEVANEYDLNIISINPYRGPAGPTLVDEGVAEGQLDELSRDTLNAYLRKSKNRADDFHTQGEKASMEPGRKAMAKGDKYFDKRDNVLSARRGARDRLKGVFHPKEAPYGAKKADDSDAMQGVAEGTLDEAVGMIIKGAAISGPDDQDIADQIAARTGGRVDSGSRGHHILITYPTPQDRAIAAKKIRKMFPGIELYKSGGNRNAIDEVSDKTLVSYLSKVSDDSLKHDQDPSKRSAEKRNRSVTGFSRAFNKLDSRKPDGSIKEASLGDYRKKAALSKATSQMDRFFGRDDPAAVSAADQTIAKREKGLARADARIKPYTPPAFDAEKHQRDLTTKYPNIDELVAQAEKNRDPYYDRAEGSAYYAGREAEQNYQKLKQIQRVIQGLNESRQKLDEFNPFSKKKVTTPSPAPAMQAASGGIKFDLMGRPYKAAPVTAEPGPAAGPVAKSVGTAMPMNPYQIPTSNTNPNPAKPAVVPNTAMTTINTPRSNPGAPYTAPADDSELQTIPAPAQLTGPAPVKQLGTNYDPNVIDVDAKVKTQPEKQMALPAPTIKPDYSKGFSGYGNTTINPATSSVPSINNIRPTNMMPSTAKAPSKPAVSTMAAKNDIMQALKKLGYKTKEAEAAIKRLPPNISTSDAIRQILRGKPTTTESLTWSRNFDPGRSLYRRMKQDI